VLTNAGEMVQFVPGDNIGSGPHTERILTGSPCALPGLLIQTMKECQRGQAHATFKIRENWPIGCKVTLRRSRMYEFLDRLVNISLPRVRDFRGVSGRAFDGRGNYNMGVKEQIIFPEIDFDQIDALRGMDIAITTTARTDEEAKALLEAFRFPFRN